MDDMVCAQPMTAPCNLQWEFVSSDDAEETPDQLLSQIGDKWRAYFIDIGQPGEPERLAEIEALIEKRARLVKGQV